MSLSVAITAIVTADVALLGLLAFVMSRATRLTPHVSSIDLAGAGTPSALALREPQAPLAGDLASLSRAA
jgi:hypothetical protein